MNNQFEQELEEVESLFYNCETGDNLDKAEARLKQMAERTEDPQMLARIYAELAQAEFWRYEYAALNERLAVAEKGVKLAKQALEYDSSSLQANAWAAAMMGLHGLEMGILSSLFYIGPISKHAKRVVEVDEAYHDCIGHQILSDLYRLSPPSPIGMKDKGKALEHLLRAKELDSKCPQLKIRLAEMYIVLRDKEKAKEEIRLLLEQNIEERGPVYAERCKARGRELLKKLV